MGARFWSSLNIHADVRPRRRSRAWNCLERTRGAGAPDLNEVFAAACVSSISRKRQARQNDAAILAERMNLELGKLPRKATDKRLCRRAPQAGTRLNAQDKVGYRLSPDVLGHVPSVKCR